MKKLTVLILIGLAVPAFCDQVIYDNFGNAKYYSNDGQVSLIQGTDYGAKIYQPNGQVDNVVDNQNGFNSYQGTTYNQPEAKFQVPSYQQQLQQYNQDNQ